MTPIQQLTDVGQWEDALRASAARPLLLFKHSTSCPISAGAHEEYRHYAEDAAGRGIDFAIVHVIEDRPVSNAIAETLGVRHQSPQAIFVQDGRSVWDESHWRITYEFLSGKLGNPGAQD